MILRGKPVADELEKECRVRIARLKRAPALAVVLVGSHAPSEAYVRAKRAAALRLGIEVEVRNLPEDISEERLLGTVEELNRTPEVDGILVQFPLPKAVSLERVIETIDARKDVDGFHPENMGKLLLGRDDGFVPCTPLGIQKLLVKSALAIESAHVVIVGRSHVVGRPLAALLVQNRKEANATVTLAHSKTENLAAITRSADILVAAVGSPHLIKAEMVRKGAVVIDVGINRLEDRSSPKGYRLVGDVDFEKVAPLVKAITPVPGGVGPMTVSMLMHNTILSAERREGR